MRIGGFISDFLGEQRCEEIQFRPWRGRAGTLHWQGGGTRMGSPLGLPLGVDDEIGFQVYVNRKFQNALVGIVASVPAERDVHNWYEVIPIASHLMFSEQEHVTTNTVGDVAGLSWPASGSTDVVSYRVYHDSKTGTVEYASTYATVYAKVGGEAATTYTWRSPRLSSGTWKFGIRAVDEAGNVQTTAREASCVVARVPDPPKSLTHTYESSNNTVTLAWTAPTNWT